jgi:hypothetical protein
MNNNSDGLRAISTAERSAPTKAWRGTRKRQ